MRLDFGQVPVRTAYDPKLLLEGFETGSTVRQRAANRIRVLNDGSADAVALARILARCEPATRCGSAACPRCQRQNRRRFGSTVAALIAGDDQPWHSVTLVPPDLSYKLGRLHNFHPKILKDRVRVQLTRGSLKDKTVVGGIDFDVQYSPGIRRSPRWRPHLYLLIRGSDRAEIRSALERYYPADKHTLVPLLVKRIRDGEINAATYALKSTFNKRYPGSRGTFSNGRNQAPIDEEHWLELSPLLHQWGFMGRQFIYRVDRGTIVTCSFADLDQAD